MNNVPNLVGNNNIGQGTATTVFLRGVGTTESIVTIDPAMGFYVDDVFIARQGVNNFSLFDVERVEVLRGPQGTLYGRNTSAGAINVITTKPQETFNVGGEIAAGEFDRVNLRGFVNVPLVEDKLLFRLNGAVEQGDGYTDNVVLNRKVNDRDFWGLRGGLTWRATDNLDFNLTADTSRSDQNGLYAINQLRPPPNLFNSISGEDTSNKGETDGINLTVDWDISDALNIQSITGFRNTYQKWNLDLSDTGEPAVFILYTINDSDQVTQEFKFTGDLFDDRLHYVGGLFYFKEESFSFIGDYFEIFGPNAQSSREYDVETESWAVYANLTFDLTDAISLIAGGRFTEDDKSLRLLALSNGTPGFELNGDFNYLFTDSQKFDEFTPRLGVTWSITDNLETYLTYQKGFKSGGWSARTNNVDEVIAFDPETNDSYALGAKWTFLEGRGRLNSEFFIYDYQNFFNTGTGAGGNFLVATNDAEIKGLEFEGTLRITDNFDIFGFLAWQDGEYTNLDPDAEFIGSELQRLPEWNYKIGGTYRYPIASGEIIANASYQFVEDHFTNLQNTELARSSDINLLDATLGWESSDGQWYVGVSCRNCTDDEYIQQSLDFAAFGFITVYPGEPRTWLVNVRVRTAN